MNERNSMPGGLERNVQTLLARCYEEAAPTAAFRQRMLTESAGAFRAEHRAWRRAQGGRPLTWGLLALAAAALLAVLYLNQHVNPPVEPGAPRLTLEQAQAMRTEAAGDAGKLAKLADYCDANRLEKLALEIYRDLAAVDPALVPESARAGVLPALGYQIVRYHTTRDVHSPAPIWQAREEWLRGEALDYAKDMENYYVCHVKSDNCGVMNAMYEQAAALSGLAGTPHSCAAFDHHLVLLQRADSAETDSLFRYYEILLNAVYENYYGLFPAGAEGVELRRHDAKARHIVILYENRDDWKRADTAALAAAGAITGFLDKARTEDTVRAAFQQLLEFTLPNPLLQRHWTTLGMEAWFTGFTHNPQTGDFHFGDPQPQLQALASRALSEWGDARYLERLAREQANDHFTRNSRLSPAAWAATHVLLRDAGLRRDFIRDWAALRRGELNVAEFQARLAAMHDGRFEAGLRALLAAK